MTNSIQINAPVEMINVIPVNPLISKCQIKVCWVGNEPNRNHSIITKDVARDLANSLPGSPIVGYYNENKGDFEDHNRILEISNGEIKMRDTTRPYGFVDLNASVWFQKFLDNGVEHEYLMTEGYLWTGQYPEAKRIIERGNNQSMELDETFIDAHWTKDSKGKPQFFIINEAIISKLCVLGEDVEPCFEGASITKFSLGDGFKDELFSLVNKMKELLEKGGTPMTAVDNDIIVEEEAVEEIPSQEEVAEEAPAAEEEIPAAEEEAPAAEEEEAEETPSEEAVDPTYSLEEIPEYVELSTKYSALEADYANLSQEKDNLIAQVEELTAFKKAVQKKEKEAMINSFYMLSDEDKKEVVDNIDSYSLEDIEAKLSIICVRNRVNFSLEDEENTTPAPTAYSLESDEDAQGLVPAWIKAIQAVAKEN